MSSENRIFSPVSAISQVGNITTLVWELNRMGYRAGLHRTHPAADWLAECGVDISKVWKNESSTFPSLGKKQRAGFQTLEKSKNKRTRT